MQIAKKCDYFILNLYVGIQKSYLFIKHVKTR